MTRSLNLLQPGPFVNKWQHRREFKDSFPFPFRLFLLVLLGVAFLVPLRVMAQPSYALTSLVKHGGVGLARGDRLLVAVNQDKPLVPASVIKLVTSLAALEELGSEYRFHTEIYQDNSYNLYLKGYGDPFLVSEEIGPLLLDLKEDGIAAINNIYIDDSAFALEGGVDGLGASLNPYDVGPAALVVNFNTVNLLVDDKGLVDSAEPQTPLIPLMTRLGKNLPPGEHRINISGKASNPTLLTGQIFRAFQHQIGIPGGGDYGIRQVPAEAGLLKVHDSSRNLLELVRGLLLYSNNFTANQIYLALGAEKYGYPATWAKSRRAIEDFLATDPLLEKGIVMVEGSGISRRNQVTVRALLRVLELFQPNALLLPEKGGMLLKSGTLNGVYSYAGYRLGPRGLDRLVIILNQPANNRDRILRIIEKDY